jgi:hypothetical protein
MSYNDQYSVTVNRHILSYPLKLIDSIIFISLIYFK